MIKRKKGGWNETQWEKQGPEKRREQIETQIRLPIIVDINYARLKFRIKPRTVNRRESNSTKRLTLPRKIIGKGED